MSIDVFLSYARQDREVAAALFEELERQGLEVWWDFGLLPGEEFAEKILSVVELSTLTVVLWSNTSVRSRWVLSEADLADRHGTLFPVCIDQTPIPMPFSRIHSASLTRDDVAAEIEALAEQIVQAVLKKAHSETAQNTPEVEDQAVKARDTLREYAETAKDGNDATDPLENNAPLLSLNERLEELLAPLQQLGELKNLSAIRKEAELANRRPRLPTRLLIKVAAIVGVLAASTSILTYAGISFQEMIVGASWNSPQADSEVVRDGETPVFEGAAIPSVETTVTPDDCAACPEMVLVQGGAYQMGSEEAEQGHRSSEGPIHRVIIGRPFYVSAHEITIEA